jgi:hypothetical protein
VADSYFASVQAPIIWLYGIGLRFIGTVKTATKEFPMGYLGRCVINEGRGSRRALLSKKAYDICSLMAYCWIDRDRKYFIATCSSLSLVTVPKMSPSNKYLALKDHFFRPHTGEERESWHATSQPTNNGRTSSSESSVSS